MINKVDFIFIYLYVLKQDFRHVKMLLTRNRIKYLDLCFQCLGVILELSYIYKQGVVAPLGHLGTSQCASQIKDFPGFTPKFITHKGK